MILAVFVGPLVVGVCLLFIGYWLSRIGKAADRNELAAYQTHVVLRELVRVVRTLGVHPRLPEGW